MLVYNIPLAPHNLEVRLSFFISLFPRSRSSPAGCRRMDPKPWWTLGRVWAHTPRVGRRGPSWRTRDTPQSSKRSSRPGIPQLQTSLLSCSRRQSNSLTVKYLYQEVISTLTLTLKVMDLTALLTYGCKGCKVCIFYVRIFTTHRRLLVVLLRWLTTIRHYSLDFINHNEKKICKDIWKVSV